MRAFLSFLESRGAGEVLARDLGDALAADGPLTRAALVAEGVIRPCALATTHPCEGLGCAREVRERSRAKDGSRRFFAVCTKSPRECETLSLGEGNLAQESIALDAFIAAVTRALRIEAPLTAATSPAAGPEEPVHLGEEIHDGRARDVFFSRKPGAPALRVLLAERRTTTRPALVLVPTARGIGPDVLAKHSRGHVEIAALTDLLVVERKKITRARALHLVPTIAGPDEALPSPANVARGGALRERLPHLERWGEVTFYNTENESQIGVEIDRRHLRLTAAELGMTSTRTGEPVRAFALLRRICDGNGVFDTRPWGGRENGKQIVSELRRLLCAGFGIAESPIAAYSRATRSWKTRFRAFATTPKVAREMESMARGGRGRREDE